MHSSITKKFDQSAARVSVEPMMIDVISPDIIQYHFDFSLIAFPPLLLSHY